MVEMEEVQSEGDFVASSSTYRGHDFQILTVSDASLIVVKSGSEVSLVCAKTNRTVGSVFKGENVLCIWLKKLKDYGLSTLCCISSSGFLIEHSLTLGYEECFREALPNFLQIPSVCYARPIIDEDGKVLKLVTVKKEGKDSYLLESKNFTKSETLLFGNVNKVGEKFLFDFNDNVIVKLGTKISNKSAEELVFANLDKSGRPFFQKFFKGSEITCIKCPSTGEKMALIGLTNGSIQIWRLGDNLAYFRSSVHWHSLPIQSLAFSPDGVYFYSGGGEGAILKWETNSSKSVAMVPRFGCGLKHIAPFDSSVVVATEHNKLKVFTAYLEDDTMIAGLSTETQTSGIYWHQPTKSIVLMGPRRTVQFFDPLTQHQKFSMEASNQDDVLGERNQSKLSLSKISHLSVSADGNWLATIETNWDTMNGNCLKFWKFSNESGQVNFECNTRVNNVHNENLTGIDFIDLPKAQGLLTHGLDGQSKLWAVEGELWMPLRTFTYLKAIPRCADCSQDKSTIAISFDNKITLWDVELLSIIATLSLSDSESNGPYTSLAFASRSCLLAADENTVHNWNLIANHLTHKISLQQPRIVKTLKLPMIITSNGIIRMDEKLRLQYLTKGISHVTSLTASESQCFFIREHFGDNVLRRVHLEDQTTDNDEAEIHPAVTHSNLSLMTSVLGKVQLTAEIDIFTPQFGPTCTASQISMPVSRNTLSILKQSIPS